MSLPVDLVGLSEELQSHGLKTENFASVARFCSNHAATFRRQAGFAYVPRQPEGRRRKKSNEPTPATALAAFAFRPVHNVADSHALTTYQLYFVLKLWAQIQVMQAEARGVPRKRHHIRKLARKMKEHLDLLPNHPFTLWARGFAHYALSDYAKAKTFLESFWKAVPDPTRQLAPWKSAETLLRYCEYQLKRQGHEVAAWSSPIQTEETGVDARAHQLTIHGYAFELFDHPSYQALKGRNFANAKSVPEHLSLLLALIGALQKGEELPSETKQTFPELYAYSRLCLMKESSGDAESTIRHLRRGMQLFNVDKQLFSRWSMDRLLNLPPSETPIPCKPIVYDLALDHVDISLERKGSPKSFFK